MKLTPKELKIIIKEELEAVLDEREKKADFPSYDAAKDAVKKGQFDVKMFLLFFISKAVMLRP